MPKRVYLSTAEVLEIHAQLMAEFGGSPEVADIGRLEAALFRPQIGYYHDLTEEAAALMESLANNNAFVDGNKRVSFAVTDTFLRLNGFYLEVGPAAARDFIVQSMARGAFRFPLIHGWLRRHIRPLRRERD